MSYLGVATSKDNMFNLQNEKYNIELHLEIFEKPRDQDDSDDDMSALVEKEDENMLNIN